MINDIKKHIYDRTVLAVLKNTLEIFFNAEITFLNSNSLEAHFIANNYNYLNTNTRQRVFIININSIILTPIVYENHVEIFKFGLLISKIGIGDKKMNYKIFNIIENSLTRQLTDGYKNKFEYVITLLDDTLITRTIALYFCKPYYHPSKVIYLINYFNKLRTTSFEGQFFSTGMILTKSDHKYSKEQSEVYLEGNSLYKPINISRSLIDRRFWYLVDGKTSYYLCNRTHFINHMITVNDSNLHFNSYLDKILLTGVLKGSDALFRVENEKDFNNHFKQ